MATRATDYIQQLADYITKNLSKRYTLDSLRVALQNQGYSRVSIERAINIANEQLARQAPKMIEKPVIKYEAVPVEQETGQEQPKKSWLKRLFGL